MNISSRPTHRRIRRSTVEIRQEKWKRAARRVIATSARQLLRDGDLIIPAQSEAAFVAMDVMPRLEQKSRPPVTQPAPGTYAGRGGDPWVFAILLILAITAFMVFLGYIATH
jgi:hypothetical protein